MTTRASHSLSPAPWQGKLGLGLGKLNGSLAEGWRPLVAEAPHAVSHPSQNSPEDSGTGSFSWGLGSNFSSATD